MERSARSCGDLDGGLATEAVVQCLHSSLLRLDLGRVLQRVRRSPLVLKQRHTRDSRHKQSNMRRHEQHSAHDDAICDSLMRRYVIIALINADVPRYCSGRYH